MPEEYVILTPEVLDNISAEYLCHVNMNAYERRHQTEQEVGEICRNHLRDVLKFTDERYITVVINDNYSIIRLLYASEVSDPINVEPDELNFVLNLLNFLSTYNAGGTKVDNLQRRVSVLEATMLADQEFYRYLELFRKRLPEFEANGVSLTIKEEDHCAIYQNGNNDPIIYSIDRAGYYRAIRALNHVAILRQKKASRQTQD